MINTIAVIFGGQSCEHEISILSALQVMNVLKTKYQVYPIYISKQSIMYHCRELFEIEAYQNAALIEKKSNEVYLVRSGNDVCIKHKKIWKRNIKIDFVFPLLHGRNGEDGSMQGMLQMLNVPYAGSGVLASALAMSKITSKQLLDYHHFPVLPYVVVDENHDTCEFMPCIIKPDNLGSSIGIQVVHDESEYQNKLKEALLYDDRCLVEPYIENFYEVNCSVRREGDVVTSHLEKVKCKEEILSFMDKYENKDTHKGRIQFESIDETISHTIKELSIRIYELFAFEGVIRIDFMVVENEVYVNEINTIPGSYAFYLWKDINFLKLLEDVMKESLHNYAMKECQITSFHSQVLFHYDGVKK